MCSIDIAIEGESCLLIDTQADISILKISSLNNQYEINTSNIVKITGITTNAIFSVGTVESKIIFNSNFPHVKHFILCLINFPILQQEYLEKIF